MLVPRTTTVTYGQHSFQSLDPVFRMICHQPLRALFNTSDNSIADNIIVFGLYGT